MERFSGFSVKHWSMAVLVVIAFFVASSPGAAATSGVWPQGVHLLSAETFCATYQISSFPVTAAGATIGLYGTPNTGDTFSFTATGNGTGTWRIVGDAGGVQTLQAGGTFPGTLTWTYDGTITVTGVGFFVDTHTGPQDAISANCAFVQTPYFVPTLSEWSLIALVMLLGALGLRALRPRRSC